MDQKRQFWAKFGRFWAKILFFTWEIISFVTHITENPPRHLVHIVFWSGIGQNVQKMAKFGPKWPKMHILGRILPFWGQNSYFLEREQKFWYSHIRKPTRHLAPIAFLVGLSTNMDQNRVAVVVRRHEDKSLCRKVWTRTKILIPLTFRFRVTAVFVKKKRPTH